MMFVINLIASMGISVYYYKYIVGSVEALGIISLTQIVILPMALTFLARGSMERTEVFCSM